MESITKRNSPLEIPPSVFSAMGTSALFCAIQNKWATWILFLKIKALQKRKAHLCFVTHREESQEARIQGPPCGPWARHKLSKFKSAAYIK